MIFDRAITKIDEDGTITYFEGSTFNMPPNDVTFYAQWQKESYSITYGNLENAENHADNPSSYTSDTQDIALEDPTKTGYEFQGWYASDDFSGDAVPSIPTGSTGDKKLFAKWAVSQYTITFDAQGGSDPDPAEIVVSYGGTYGTLTATSRSGYEFLGWYTGENGSGTKVTASIAITSSSDHILYAYWQKQDYSITYNNLENAVNHTGNPVSYTAESPDITLGNPTKTGYDFQGWYTSADFSGDTVLSIPTGSTGDRTLFAKWTASQYTITFDSQGGSDPDPAEIVVSYGGTYGTLTAVSRSGYEFLGWYTGENGSGTKVTASIAITSSSDHILYAYWQKQDYSITYNNLENAVNHTGNPVSYTAESPDITLGNPTKTGYDFQGWYTSADFSGDAVTSISTGSIGDRTLFAKWTASQYTITFDAQGGSDPDPAEIVVSYGGTYGTLTATSRSGYEFLGWHTGENGSGTKVTASSTVSATSDHSLYAYWMSFPVENVSIIGDTITGSELTAITDPLNATVDYRWQIADISDGTFSNIPGATNRTYVIKTDDEGKYIRVIANGTGLYTGTSISNATRDVLLKYVITYGNLENAVNHTGNPVSYTAESPDITLGNPTKTGYDFQGWYTSADFSGDAVTSISTGSIGDRTLFAKWTASQYTITFDSQGGSDPDPAEIVVSYSGTYGPLATVEKTGHTFDGWWTEQDGTGDLITTDSIVSVASNLTLYANWVPNDYTITYNDPDGTIEGSTTKIVTYGQAYGELANTTRESYSFAGWWTEAGGTGTEVTEATIFTETTDRILYAKWTFDVFTGPAGGFVFYENPNHETEDWRYLEAAPYGWYDGGDDPSVQWGAYGYAVDPPAAATAVGSGEINTTNINEYHTNLWDLYKTKGDFFTNPTEYSPFNDGTVAAKICADYSMVNEDLTYDDWFLPSKDELNLMYLNLKIQGFGNVSGSSYWSSSEKDSDGYGAWRQWFTTGDQENNFRYANNSIRPVRAY